MGALRLNIYGLGDLHLSFSEKYDDIYDEKIEVYKPMDCFGEHWEKHYQKIYKNWNEFVNEDEYVLIPGDISWAMKLDEVTPDFHFLSKLNGHKILIKGNHDYWWNSIKKVREKLPKNTYALQNDSFFIAETAIAGTRGWIVPNDQEFSEHDEKIFNREIHRLKLSLETLTSDYDTLIVMFHYMPVNSQHEKNELIELMQDYKVDYCVYGHLHGRKSHQVCITEKKWGIEFKLVSADYLNFSPAVILKI